MTKKIGVFRNMMSYVSDDVYQQDSATFIFRQSRLVTFYGTRWRRRPVDPKVYIPGLGPQIYVFEYGSEVILNRVLQVYKLQAEAYCFK